MNIGKAAGDSVAEDEVIAQIETDKVTIDVRAPHAGTVTRILVRPPSLPIPIHTLLPTHSTARYPPISGYSPSCTSNRQQASSRCRPVFCEMHRGPLDAGKV